MNDASRLRQRLAYRDQLLSVLSDAQKLRSKLSRWEGGELVWVKHERISMYEATNVLARKPVSMERIRQAESMAQGHSDYSSKFALYCAELALGEA